MQIAPSLLSANFLTLQRELDLLQQAKADLLHIDVMDGHFVPNLTFGPIIIEKIAHSSTIPLDIHLMVDSIPFFIDLFKSCKPRYISFHLEANPHPHRTISYIRQNGISPAIALNPHTPLEMLDYLLEELDMVLLMSVNPGFGGQSFISQTLRKISALKERILKCNLPCLIEVDGGINHQNAQVLKDAGADILVAGNYIFTSPDYTQAIQSLRV